MAAVAQDKPAIPVAIKTSLQRNDLSLGEHLGVAMTIGLLIVGGARLAQVVLHTPMLGYANNYDFIKISSTVGLWVDEPGIDRYAGHPSAPLRYYRSHGPRHPEMRYLSSELPFVYLAIGLADVWGLISGGLPNRFDLKVLGLTKTAFFSLAGIFLTILFRRRSAMLGVLSAAVFAVVIADPMNSLYFNTLYFDDSALFFAYLAVGLGLYLSISDDRSTVLVAVFCAVLLFLGVSKMQHAGLSLAIVLAFGLAYLGRARNASLRQRLSRVLPPLCAAVVALWLGVVNNRSPSMRGMVHAAATDSWFGTVLPAMDDAHETLRWLGIPERCLPCVGKTWYSEGMQPAPCPEIFGLSRFRMVQLLMKEPNALWRIVKKAIPATRPFIVFYGQVEGHHFGRLTEEGARFASIGELVGKLPSAAYVALWVANVLGALLSFILLMRVGYHPGWALSVFLSAVLVATFLACLLGDGYVGLARHFHVGQSGFLIAPVVTVQLLFRLSFRAFSPR